MFSSGIVGQPLRLPNRNWQAMRLLYNSISERSPQNRAPAFVLILRMRCRPLARTRTRSRIHRRDSLRGEFLNSQGGTWWRGCLLIRQAKHSNKRRETPDHLSLFRQKFGAPAVNRSDRESVWLLQQEMVRLELRRLSFSCEKIRSRVRRRCRGPTAASFP